MRLITPEQTERIEQVREVMAEFGIVEVNDTITWYTRDGDREHKYTRTLSSKVTVELLMDLAKELHKRNIKMPYTDNIPVLNYNAMVCLDKIYHWLKWKTEEQIIKDLGKVFI